MNPISNIAAISLFISLTACGRSYESVPDPYHGKWVSDNLTNIVNMEISTNRIVLIDDDLNSEACIVKHVNITYSTFGNGKKLIVHCNVDSLTLRKRAQRYCNFEGSKINRWNITIEQDDSDRNNYVDISTKMEMGCDDLHYNSTIGFFQKIEGID